MGDAPVSGIKSTFDPLGFVVSRPAPQPSEGFSLDRPAASPGIIPSPVIATPAASPKVSAPIIAGAPVGGGPAPIVARSNVFGSAVASSPGGPGIVAAPPSKKPVTPVNYSSYAQNEMKEDIASFLRAPTIVSV
jgi:hypothetical protein